LILIDRDNLDGGTIEQQVEFAPAGVTLCVEHVR